MTQKNYFWNVKIKKTSSKCCKGYLMSRRLSSYVVIKKSVNNGENTKIKKCSSVKNSV